MNLLQIEYFLTLAKLGSFRKTAEHLYVSQPAVSKQISLLEKEWGITLFHRGYRTAELTPGGKIMLDMLQDAQKSFHEAIQLAKIMCRPECTELKLGIPEGSDFLNLSNIICNFQKEHPDIVVNVKCAPISHLLIEFPDGCYDIVIAHERSLRNKSELCCRVLSKRKHIAVISRHHPLYRSGNVSFKDLKNERIYVPTPDNTTLTVDYCSYICAHHGFIPCEMKQLPNVESVLLAVKMCFGIAVLDDLVVLPEQYDLAIIPTNVHFNLNLAWHKSNQNPGLELLANEIILKSSLTEAADSDQV